MAPRPGQGLAPCGDASLELCLPLQRHRHLSWPPSQEDSRPRPFSGPRRIARAMVHLPYFMQAPLMRFRKSVVRSVSAFQFLKRTVPKADGTCTQSRPSTEVAARGASHRSDCAREKVPEGSILFHPGCRRPHRGGVSDVLRPRISTEVKARMPPRCVISWVRHRSDEPESGAGASASAVHHRSGEPFGRRGCPTFQATAEAGVQSLERCVSSNKTTEAELKALSRVATIPTSPPKWRHGSYCRCNKICFLTEVRLQNPPRVGQN